MFRRKSDAIMIPKVAFNDRLEARNRAGANPTGKKEPPMSSYQINTVCVQGGYTNDAVAG